MVAPLVLVIGVLYMGQYRENLIRAELATLQMQAQLFAGAIAEGSIRPVQKGRPFLFARPEEIEVMIPERARRMVRRMGETTTNRTRLFNTQGTLTADSQQLAEPAETAALPASSPRQNSLSHVLTRRLTALMEYVPSKTKLPPYPHTASEKISFYPNADAALKGHMQATAWQNNEGKVILTAAAPVQKAKQLMGAVLLTREGRSIEAAMIEVRSDVLTAFGVALGLTIFLSLYLSGMIVRPLRRLARASEAIRLGKNRTIDIPNLDHRNDEIGELASSLRAMTQALWDRMDMIESFAADVSHEIKNPLTSLRSAVETAVRLDDPEKRNRLMAIILHDVQRLDRLISDISNASRLDAELSRDEMRTVDLGRLLQQLADAHRKPMDRGDEEDSENSRIVLNMPVDRPVTVRGNETRLAQVFENLISNALSFSPADESVIVSVGPGKHQVVVTVEDRGPGIPENKLDTIFQRFYTERPKHESYGKHSGLGLSIARQIVETLGGQIFAGNVRDAEGAVVGARFTVILDAA